MTSFATYSIGFEIALACLQNAPMCEVIRPVVQGIAEHVTRNYHLQRCEVSRKQCLNRSAQPEVAREDTRHCQTQTSFISPTSTESQECSARRLLASRTRPAGSTGEGAVALAPIFGVIACVIAVVLSRVVAVDDTAAAAVFARPSPCPWLPLKSSKSPVRAVPQRTNGSRPTK